MSLGTEDSAMAALMRRKLELEVRLRQPELRSVALPEKIVETFGDRQAPAVAPAAVAEPVAGAPNEPIPASPPISEVLEEYLAYINAEDSKSHATNKKTYLRKFFGSALVAGGESWLDGVFKGATLSDVTAGDVRRMIDALPVGTHTKKHYRDAFHSLYEFSMKYGFFIPVNFRYPNPMSALPGYHRKNKQIIYLKQAAIDHVLQILEPCPAVRIAVAIMIYAGLRRAEMLWLRKENLAPELRYFSVVNKTDEESDIESS